MSSAHQGTTESAPSLFASSDSWRGSELPARSGWSHQLSATETAEIRQALVDSRQLTVEQLTVETFRLPTLAPRLKAAGQTLEHGVGSFLLRGWLVDEHSTDDNERVFWGLSRHLGTPISQSAAGEKIFRVEDAGFGQADPRTRGPNTRRGLSFHCDRCDVIGFLCVRKAKRGGESYLVSSIAIHNEIHRRRPDLLQVLYQPYYYKTHNVDRANPDPWCKQPVFAVVEDRFVGYLLRVLIERAYELPELPNMTAAQREALDLIDELCADPNLHYSFLQEPGDLLFVNNFVNFHSRSEFEDHAETDRRRLLLRIWLSIPDSRRLPELFRSSFGRIGAGEIRGGIHPPD